MPMRKADIIDGRLIAQDLVRRVRDDVARLRKFDRLIPGLAVVLVGENPASRVYVRTKTKRSEEVGIRSFMHQLPADVRAQEVLTLIRGLNADERVHGILVQLPLPDHIDEAEILAAVDPAKDVDGFHVINAGRLAIGDPRALVPCTPTGCLILIKSRVEHLTGLKALIIGRSNIVGKPMAQLLLRENCTVTVAHSKTADLAGECRQADIVVVAVGLPRLVRADWIKPGAIVIDVGINRVPGEDGKSKLVGDVDYHDVLAVAGAVTPVPGGVGPMTVACLMRNTVVAACRQRGVPEPDDLAPMG